MAGEECDTRNGSFIAPHQCSGTGKGLLEVRRRKMNENILTGVNTGVNKNVPAEGSSPTQYVTSRRLCDLPPCAEGPPPTQYDVTQIL